MDLDSQGNLIQVPKSTKQQLAHLTPSQLYKTKQYAKWKKVPWIVAAGMLGFLVCANITTGFGDSSIRRNSDFATIPLLNR
jgi:hypothetical protein